MAMERFRVALMVVLWFSFPLVLIYDARLIALWVPGFVMLLAYSAQWQDEQKRKPWN